MKTGTLLIIGLIAATLMGMKATMTPAPATAPAKSVAPAVPVVTLDKSEAAQAKRQGLVRQFIKGGVLAKVEAVPGVARAYVRPPFMALDLDTKSKIAGLVYALTFDGTGQLDLVRLIDASTGRTIGTWAPDGGLALD